MQTYHDAEWGVPLFDDKRLFEFLILEGMQAGLSWLTVLKKREALREAFDRFDAEKVARYGKANIRELLRNPTIIRNRLKIEAAITNAQAFLKVQEDDDGFHRFLWNLIDGRPIINAWTRMSELPATTPASDRMSEALRQRGFRFVGSTICYAHMQATGMVNDHLTSCFRYRPLVRTAARR